MIENSEALGNETSPRDESIALNTKGHDLKKESKTTLNSDKNQSDASLACISNEKSVGHVGIKIDEDHKNSPAAANLSHPPAASKAEVLVDKALCADYKSGPDSDTDSDSDFDTDDSSFVDSDSDSLDSESDSSSPVVATKINKKKKKVTNGDLPDSKLPPIENLKITVPEEECEELGVISGIVGTIVVVEAYKNTPAYDIDTVLFLDKGQKTLGKIFDVFGRISEPVYSVRFNNSEEIQKNEIRKGLKVYCAPKTEHASLVFVSELMKMKGSDASWKNNEETPREFQDFSNDEDEERFKKKELEASRNDAAKAEQAALPEQVSPKKARFYRPIPNQNARNDYPRNPPQYQMNLTHSHPPPPPPPPPPPTASNNWALYPQRPRFPVIPRNSIVQPAYQYPPQAFYGQGYYPQAYQRPSYGPNFPPSYPNPQFVYQTPSPFLLPPPPPPYAFDKNSGPVKSFAGEPPRPIAVPPPGPQPVFVYDKNSGPVKNFAGEPPRPIAVPPPGPQPVFVYDKNTRPVKNFARDPPRMVAVPPPGPQPVFVYDKNSGPVKNFVRDPSRPVPVPPPGPQPPFFYEKNPMNDFAGEPARPNL